MESYKQLIILVDNSGKGEEKYGHCLCFWCAFLYDPFDLKSISNTAQQVEKPEIRYEIDILTNTEKAKPIRSGAIYCDYEGPNKIFYDGIIRSLDGCLFLTKRHSPLKVIVIGDCEPVIKQLKNQWQSKKMKSFYLQTKGIEKKYKDNGAEMNYRWIKRDDFPLYLKIDKLAKDFLEKIKGQFKLKNNE